MPENKLPFIPSLGKESSFLKTDRQNGRVFFATDTGAIYLDTIEDRISMGGTGASVFFCNTSNIVKKAGGIYIIQYEDLKNANSLPKKQDLIINIKDGKFYQVNQIQGHSLYCSLIAVSGTGGSSGGSGGSDGAGFQVYLEFNPDYKIQESYIYGYPSFVKFTPITKIDSKVTFTYEIYDENGNMKNNTIFINANEEYSFDIGSLLYDGKNDITFKLSTQNDGSNEYNFEGKYTYKIGLKPSSRFNPVQAILGPSFTFYCETTGNVSKVLKIFLDNNLEPIAIKNLGTGAGLATIEVSAPNGIIPHKHCQLTAILEEPSSGAQTEPLIYEIAWTSLENLSIPIIWIADKPTEIDNYENLIINYMVYDPTKRIDDQILSKTKVSLQINDEVAIDHEVDYNAKVAEKKFVDWPIVNYKEGKNILKLTCGVTKRTLEIQVNPNSRNLELSNIEDLKVNLTAKGRTNSEPSVLREKWSYEWKDNSGNITIRDAILNNFNWYNNGWVLDEDGNSCLRISNGSSVKIPFPGKYVYNQMGGAFPSATFEFRFKVKNIQKYEYQIRNITQYQVNGVWKDSVGEDEEVDKNEYGYDIVRVIKQISSSDGVFGQFFNNDIGICLGVQEGFLATKNGAVSARYDENQLITASFVIDETQKLIQMYINGVMSGVVAETEPFQINSEYFIFNSNYCDIDLYDVRVYRSPLDIRGVTQNYLSDKRSIELYDQNNEIYGTIERDSYGLSEPTIDYNGLLSYNANCSKLEDLSMCYMTISLVDNDGKSKNAANNIISVDDNRLPYYKGDKRKISINFVNPSLDWALDKGLISKEEYLSKCPSFKATKAELDVQGTSSQGYPRRNYKCKLKNSGQYSHEAFKDDPSFELWHMDNSECATDVFTWKIDYMESSSCHNTGLANLMDTMYEKHPMEYYNFDGVNVSKYRTTVYGFPCLVFHEKSRNGIPTGEYEFIGKYNFNLDKSSNEYYGYKDKNIQPYMEGNPKISDVAESWELRNNQGFWTSFRLPLGKEWKSTKENGLREYLDHFEYRYSKFKDELDDIYDFNKYGTSDKLTQNEANALADARYANLEKLFMWLNSTDVNNATNQTIPEQTFIVEEAYMKILKNNITDANGSILVEKDSFDADQTYYIFDEINNKIEIKNILNQVEFENFLSIAGNELYINYDENNSKNEVVDLQIEKTFTQDNVQYRLAKFKTEFNKHLNMEYCLVYFVLTELLIMFDSRGKNMFLSSWGPTADSDGEYVWFPVFYDMDTQLGVNNTGIPTYEYDTNATEDNAFSTSNSVLWNNFYTCFKRKIKEKYKQLRGMGQSGRLSQKKIEDSYNYSPETYSNSYAMKGVRPFIIHNIDEYYKYLAPTKSGYYDTNGNLQKDSGSFYYALQGTRELYRKSLLRNRLNYIDSWWNANTYTTDTTSSASLWMRINFNDYNQTSDKWVDRQLTSEEEEESILMSGTDPLDATVNFSITPYLNQFISIGYDAIYTQATKPVNGVAEPQAAESIQIACKTQTGLPDQLVYIPGAEYLEDVGDLSVKYLSELHLNTASRLKKLKLGNDDPRYFNNAFVSNKLVLADDGGPDSSKPLLNSIILTGLSGLSDPINVKGSPKLEEFRALRTSLKGVSLAEGVAIKTLHLPETIESLSLIKAWNLDVITPERSDALNEEGKPISGLFIDGITNKPIDQIDKIALNSIEIEGGSLGLQSYDLLHKLISVKKKMFNEDKGNPILAISMTDLQWTPYSLVEKNSSYDLNKTYYIRTNHYTYIDGHIGEDDFINLVNEEKLYIKQDSYNSSITSLEMLKSLGENNKIIIDGAETKQFTGVALVEGEPRYPTLSGEIFINNSEENKINDWEVKEIKTNYFPDLEIYCENINEGVSVQFIQIKDGKEVVLYNDLYEPKSIVRIYKPVQDPVENYFDFVYWYEKGKETINFFGENTVEYIDFELPEGVKDIKLYAKMEPHEYEFTFKYKTEDLSRVEDGNNIIGRTFAIYQENVSKEIDNVPRLLDDDLLGEMTYVFKGYVATDNKNDTNIIDFEKEVCLGENKNYYAYFVTDSVYNNPSPLELFTFEEFSRNNEKEYAVKINDKYYLEDENGKLTKCSVRGKITIPTHYQGIPVTRILGPEYSYSGTIISRTNGFALNNNITHIYWYETENEPLALVDILKGAFEGAINLKYFQFESKISSNNNIVEVGQYSFRMTASADGGTLNNRRFPIDTFGQNSFNKAFKEDNITLTLLPKNKLSINKNAFGQNSIQAIQIGDEKHYITLNPDDPNSFWMQDNAVFGGETGLDGFEWTVYCKNETLKNKWEKWFTNKGISESNVNILIPEN